MYEVVDPRHSAYKWKRSANGIIAGVCQGIGESLGIHPNWIRVIWLLTVCLWGTGLALYLLLAFSIPREDRSDEFKQKKVLGVCLYLSRHWNVEVGPIRFVALLSLVSSLGLTLLLYVLLYVLLVKNKKSMI